MEEVEIWKDIIGYEGLYQVSNMGAVKSLYRTYTNSLGRQRVVPERILKNAVDKDGYTVRTLYRQGGKAKLCKVHRLVAIAFVPNTENKPEVNHLNGVRSDNRVSQLEWSTTSDNLKHSFRVLGKKPNMPTVETIDKSVMRAKEVNSKIVINIENGIFYLSVKEAALTHNIKPVTLVAILKGRIKNKTPLRYA